MKVIFFKTKNSTFVLKDQAILTHNYPTKVFYINTESPARYFFALIKLIFFLLFVSWKADVFFIRFADWHTAIIAFFKKIYHKKLCVVIGGYDVAAIPQINYGLHIRKGRSRFARYAMKNATYLLPVSPNLVRYENKFVAETPVYGGISYFVPKIKGQIKVIPNGFDGIFWQKKPEIVKQNIILTVAQVSNDITFYLKGLDMFIKCAEKFPDCQFNAVGVSGEYLNSYEQNLPSNFKAIPSTTPEELLEYYSMAKVFCLFSLSEGMPNVLCEAMLCECIPVGTDVTSIPHIIGDSGFVIKNKRIEEYENGIQEALNADQNIGKSARNRILLEFSLEQRKASIIDLLNNL